MKGFSILIILLFLISCKKNNSQRDDFILRSDREAPLGWTYFTIYSDSTFEYISRGLREKDIYKGKALIKKDSIFLNYYDSIPNVGKRVFLAKGYLEFIDLESPYRLEIKLNKIN